MRKYNRMEEDFFQNKSNANGIKSVFVGSINLKKVPGLATTKKISACGYGLRDFAFPVGYIHDGIVNIGKEIIRLKTQQMYTELFFSNFVIFAKPKLSLGKGP